MQIPVAPSLNAGIVSFLHQTLPFVQNEVNFHYLISSSGLCTLPPGGKKDDLKWAKETLHQAQLTPAPDLVSDVYFMLLRKPDLDVGNKFLEDISAVAATVAHMMNPAQVTLVFETFMKLKWMHTGLLESFAESMIGSGDISFLHTTDICAILHALAKIHRQKVNAGNDKEPSTYVLFPSEKKFVNLLIDEVVDSRLHRLDRNEISRMVHSLALLNVEGGTALEKLTHMIETRRNLRGFTDKELASMIYSFALMESSDRFTVEILALEIASMRRRPNLLPGDVAMTIYSLGRLGYRHLNKIVGDLSSVLQLSKFVKMARSKELASIVYAFGELGYNDKQAVEAVLKELLQYNRLESLGGCEIVSVLNGMAKLFYQNEVVLRALCKIFLSQIDKWDTKELCAVAHALGKLRYKHVTLLKAIAVEVAQPEHARRIQASDVAILIHALGLLSYRDLKVLKPLLQHWTLPHKLEQFSEQGLTMLMHGLAMCHVKDDSLFQNILDEVVSPQRLPSMGSLGLSCCVFSLGQLGVKNKQVLGLLGLELMKNHRRATISKRQIAIFIYSFGKLGFNHASVTAFLKLALEPEMLLSFTDQDLANMLYGLALLGCSAFDAPRLVALEMVRREKLGQLHEKRLSLCIYCLGKLGVRNYIVIDALLTSAIKKGSIKLLDSSGLLQIFMGISWLAYNNVSVIRSLVNEVIRRQKESNLKNHEISKVVQALGVLGVNEESGVVPLLSLVLASKPMENFTGRDLERIHEAVQFMGITRKIELTKEVLEEIKKRLGQRSLHAQVPSTA